MQVGTAEGILVGDLLGLKVGCIEGVSVPAVSTVTAEKTCELAKIKAVRIASVTEGADIMLNIVSLGQTDFWDWCQCRRLGTRRE